ncbi:polysaccharide deacetylase family protein [Mycobacterium sp. SMC-8]|uniref:polysaccharide deacetylase family protein n=1 Tax=Mycobacterium sp. SMC-8 TaxID=2857060 RepID=UPI0021B4D4BA|nr:polysaccharide deacetylase family protein [Mycobacterium sp. SMC-8]UXA12955.1 polysaccharide deacetylase family protein [Mycobacterium sp. SMC-8]
MKAMLKELAARSLCALGVPILARWRRSHRLAILMFHGVESEPLSPPCDWVIDTATLRRDLDYVRRHFNVLPLEEALGRLRDGTLPGRAAAVTFDDGTRNLLTNAAPVLRELAVPAAVFLATGPMGTSELLWPDRLWSAFAQTNRTEIDLSHLGLGKCPLSTEAERTTVRDSVTQLFKQLPEAERITGVDSVVGALGAQSAAHGGPFQLLSWDEAAALAADGLVTLYPHTVTHPILARCDDDKVGHEITESCRAVENHTGRAPAVFAYPNGCEQDYDDRAKEVLRNNGIRWALTTTNGFVDARSDPLELPRMGFSTDQSFAVFKLKVSGFSLRPGRKRKAPALNSDVGEAASDVTV